MDLTALRADVVQVVASGTGLKAIEYVSENITPPVVVVVPSEPYVSWPEGGESVTFARKVTVRLDVLVIVGSHGANKKSAEDIDDMVQAVVVALNAPDDEGSSWSVTEVGQPNLVTLSGSKFLGSVIRIEQKIEEP